MRSGGVGGSGLGLGYGRGEGGSSIEVTVTTRTTVDVVDVRRVEEERRREEEEEEGGERRRTLRRTRSDFGGGSASPTSDRMPGSGELEEMVSASLPASMRLSSPTSSPHRRPLVHQYFTTQDEEDPDRDTDGEEDECPSALPELSSYHRFGLYDGASDAEEGQTHSKPGCAAEAETANDSNSATTATTTHLSSSALARQNSHPLPSTPLARPPRSLQPERPVLPHLIIDPHIRTSTSTSHSSSSRSSTSANVTFRPSS